MKLRSYASRIKYKLMPNALPRAALKKPYPVMLTLRDYQDEVKPDMYDRSGTETFKKTYYQAINEARLAHLASLQLPLAGKSVIDVGCGVGDLSRFFVEQGCDVTCVDGREENITRLKGDYPDMRAFVADVQKDDLSQLGHFDVVFCYGLLYHLEDIVAGLRTMEKVCDQLLIIETKICDYLHPIARIIDETKGYSEALRGLAHRPSPSYVVLALNRIGFQYIYAPREQPDHPEFQFVWRNDLSTRKNDHDIRGIFIASRVGLNNPSLVSLI